MLERAEAADHHRPLLQHGPGRGRPGAGSDSELRAAGARRRPITVATDQSRAFTHVADVIEAMLKLVAEPTRSDRSSTSAIPTRSACRHWQSASRLAGSTSTIKLVPYADAYESGFEDMPRRLPDLTKVRAMIGYAPKYGLDDILTQVIDDFRRK